MSDTKTQLKPCPFCGGAASVEHGCEEAWIDCDECGVSGPMRDTESQAVAEWNRRIKETA